MDTLFDLESTGTLKTMKAVGPDGRELVGGTYEIGPNGLVLIGSTRGKRVQPDIPAEEAIRMTQHEYQMSRAAQVAGGVPILNAADRRQHKQLIREALARGESIPKRVLADYPDLT